MYELTEVMNVGKEVAVETKIAILSVGLRCASTVDGHLVGKVEHVAQPPAQK